MASDRPDDAEPAPAPRPLNATAAALLGLLLERPLSGWDLVALAEERIGQFWSLTRSQVYRELATMAGRGLVAAGPAGPRDRTPYQVTDAGRAAFAAWLATPPGRDQVRIPLLLTLAFAGHLPRPRLDAIVAEQRAVHRERLTRYRAQREALGAAPDVPEVAAALATLEFGLRYEEAVLGWFDALPAILDRPG